MKLTIPDSMIIKTSEQVLNSVKKWRDILESFSYKVTKETKRNNINIHKSLLELYFGMPVDELEKRKFSFIDGTPLNCKIKRIVVGAHGPYVEIKKLGFKTEVPEDQKWRYETDKHIKYFHLQPVGRTEKIYKQISEVSYADYKPNHYYIDLYLLKVMEE